MTNTLIKLEASELDVYDNMEKTRELAKKLASTKHYQKLGEDGIFAICMFAKANKMPQVDALNGELYYIQGRVGISAEAMNKYIRLQGHSITLKRLDEKGCTLVGKRKDTGDTAEVSYTYEDMKRAGKNYDKNLLDMYFARAISRLKRILFPDLWTKIYTKEELEDLKEDEQTQSFVEIESSELKNTITTDQAIELTSLLQQCSEEVQENAMEFIKSKFKIELIDDLPSEEFEKYKKLFLKRREEYLKQKEEINTEEENAAANE